MWTEFFFCRKVAVIDVVGRGRDGVRSSLKRAPSVAREDQ